MNVTYVRTEIRRMLRTPRYMIFAVVFPLVLFLVLSNGSEHINGVPIAAFFMVSMATFGAMNAAIASGGRIAIERSIGWMRQLRLTGLSSRSYFTGKVLIAFVSAVPAVAAVFLAAAVLGKVHLPAEHWLVAFVTILVGLVPMVAFGVYLGTWLKPDTLQPIIGITSAMFALLGGFWFALSGWFLHVAKVLPAYWIADGGREAVTGGWVGWTGTLVLLGWTVLFGVLAAGAYRRSARMG
jgi:ABC-2 type transport system permease protein